MIRFALGWAFDTYINLRVCIHEAIKQAGYLIDDALEAWGEDEDG